MPDDLSVHHRPLDASMPPEPASEDFARYALTREQLESYRRDGFLSGIRALDGEQLEALRDELDRISRPDCSGREFYYEYHADESADPSRVLFHALGAWRLSRAFHDLLWNPAVLIPAWQLLEGPVRFWHDQLFCKPPMIGGAVAWHQDYSYWTRTRPQAHLSCWIGLDDSHESSGCLRYIPGSHRWDLLPVTGLAGEMDAIRSVLSPEQEESFNPVPVCLSAGEASFHHPLTVHGSFVNTSSAPRRATIINVFRDGVLSASDTPLLEGVPPIAAGSKVSGRFFPLLYPTAETPG